MIYISELIIGNRDNWGGVTHIEVPLPSRIKTIRGITANVLPTEYTVLNADITIDESTNIVSSIQYKCVPIGSFSVCINNTDIIKSNIPAYILSLLDNGSYRCNKNTLVKPVLVTSGSVVRICYEERQLTPFVGNDLDANTAKMIRLAHFPNMESLPQLTNSYTIKFYIDYD